MNIPKLGEVLAEIHDKLLAEQNLALYSRSDISGKLESLKAALIKHVSSSIDEIALQIDVALAESAGRLYGISNGEQQKPEIDKAE